MNISKEFTKQEHSAVKLTVTINKEDVGATYEDTVKKYIKNAQIPGFRKGHVPKSVLENKFSDNLKADTLSTLIDNSIKEIFSDDANEYKPLAYEQPRMDGELKFEKDKDLQYSIIYDVYPKVEIKGIVDITIKVPNVKISDSDIESELKTIQERNAIVESKKDDEVAVKGDIVTIKCVDLDAEKKEVPNTVRDDFTFNIGSGENIYRFDDDIVGMKKGDKKIITVTYDKETDPIDLKGKTITRNIEIKELKFRNLPALNDELAQDVSEKYKTFEDMRQDVAHSLNTALTNKIKEVKQLAFLEEAVKLNDFELPRSMVNMEVAARLQEIAGQFKISVKEIDRIFTIMGKTREEAIKQITANVEKALKSRIIIDTLIKQRNISVTPEEVENKYKEIASDASMTIEEVKKHYDNQQNKEYLIADIKEEKMLDVIYKEIKIEKGEDLTFKELFSEEGKSVA